MALSENMRTLVRMQAPKTVRHVTQGISGTTPLARPMASPLGISVEPVDDQATPATLRLTHGSCILGASPEADLVIDNNTVSRKHVRLELVPEGIAVQDLGSRNGTFYLGSRVERIVLPIGARLRLGSCQVQLSLNESSLDALPLGPTSYGELSTASSQMRRLFSLLRRLEGSMLSVLIMGESGTGKELIAQAIHQNSYCNSGPIVSLNCGVLSNELVRSELFGHAKGAFTGANSSRIGAFEQATGGTLFLDEIGELPLDIQPLLLRVLQEREVQRLGENNPRPVSVRLIAATNRDLEREVKAGTFREDLYYRLKVVQLNVPPLDKRPEDIQHLAMHFASLEGVKELPPDVLTMLERRPWPGNVRELRHAVAAYVALGELPGSSANSGQRPAVNLFSELDVSRPYEELKKEYHEHFQRAYVRSLMAKAKGNVSEGARMGSIDRSYLGKLVKRLLVD